MLNFKSIGQEMSLFSYHTCICKCCNIFETEEVLVLRLTPCVPSFLECHCKVCCFCNLQTNGSAYENHGLVTIRIKPDAQGRFGFNSCDNFANLGSLAKVSVLLQFIIPCSKSYACW